MRQDYRAEEGSFKTGDCSGGTARASGELVVEQDVRLRCLVHRRHELY